MRSRTFEVPGVLALLLLLVANYGLGYGLGINLTGSVIVAVLLAFALPCLAMMVVVWIAVASGAFGNSAR